MAKVKIVPMVTVISPKGERVEVEVKVGAVLVLRHGYRNLIEKSEEELEAEKLALEKLEHEEKASIRKILKKLKVEFNAQLGLKKLKELLAETLAE
jgi:hypothetical protein